MEVHAFLKGIYPKMKVTAQLGFGPAHYDVAVQHVSHNATGTYPERERVEVGRMCVGGRGSIYLKWEC